MIDGLFRWLRDKRGAVSPLMALLVVPIVGALALAGETGGWYYVNRSAQNAADSAAVAAATNNCTTGSCGATYDQEARGAAARFGFVNGTDNATVTPTYPVTCPDGTAGCYRVTVSKIIPVNMGRIVGFNGDVALGGGRGQTVTASATARGRVNAGFCITTLGTGNDSFVANGTPKFDLGGCDTYSNGTATCNGSSDRGIAAGVARNGSNCGVTPTPNQPLDDPDLFDGLATNIQAAGTNCATTYNAPATFPATLNLTAGPVCVNGNISVPAGGTTITSPAGGGVIRVYNGSIALNGTLSAPFGNGTTIIFSGTPPTAGTPGFFTGNGIIEMSAPSTGVWSGVAVYQDPRMPGASTLTYSGAAPTFNITGLVYLPKADLRLDGAINHHTGGYSCLGLVANKLLLNGTGSIFDNASSQCAQAGLTLPTGPTLLIRQALVQ